MMTLYSRNNIEFRIKFKLMGSFIYKGYKIENMLSFSDFFQ